MVATMTGRRQIKKEMTRERILAAALELFQSRGFEAATTKHIARRAKIAEGTIFNYFKTKEDIALYFFEKEMDAVMESFASDARLKKAPLEEKLFALIQRQLEYLEPYERFMGAVVYQAFKPTSKLSPFSLESRELQLRYLKFVQGLFDEAAAKGEIGPLSWWGAQAFWMYYLGVLAHWLHDASPGKENTMAFLDRSLKIGTAILRKGGLV